MFDLEGLKREAKTARDEYEAGRGSWRVLPRGEKLIMGWFTVAKVEALIAQAESRVDPVGPAPLN